MVAQRGGEGGVEVRIGALVVEVEAVEDDVRAEGAEGGVEGGAGAEQVPEVRCGLQGGGGRGQGHVGVVAAEADEDLFLARLAGSDCWCECGAVL